MTRVYPADFRRRAVALAHQVQSARVAARRLGVYYQTIHRWVREHVEDPKWRCECDPAQLRRGPICPSCSATAPPR